MNKDILAGKWKEMKGRVKEQWGKITDDELDRAEGRAEQMVGLLQQRYGYTKEKAQDEYDRFMNQYQEPEDQARRFVQVDVQRACCVGGNDRRRDERGRLSER